MLLRGNKQSHKLTQILIASPHSSHPAPLPHRHSMTAKSKTRGRTPTAANKTISIRPDPHRSSAPGSFGLEHSGELLPNSSFSFYNNQSALSEFDNLQLQDFLKYVIVGENKVSDDKSKEIIRSLNGTWFKNTNSSQLPAPKLYNNLGVRRAKVQSRGKDEGAVDHGKSEYHFMKEYTPPNVFPGKKIETKRLYPSRSFYQEEVSENTRVSEVSPLKLNIMKRKPQSESKARTSGFNRSQSQFEKKKSMLFGVKESEAKGSEGLVKGMRMQLHRD